MKTSLAFTEPFQGAERRTWYKVLAKSNTDKGPSTTLTAPARNNGLLPDTREEY